MWMVSRNHFLVSGKLTIHILYVMGSNIHYLYSINVRLWNSEKYEETIYISINSQYFFDIMLYLHISWMHCSANHSDRSQYNIGNSMCRGHSNRLRLYWRYFTICIKNSMWKRNCRWSNTNLSSRIFARRCVWFYSLFFCNGCNLYNFDGSCISYVLPKISK